MNGLDIAALIILMIGGLTGYRKGLITGASHFVGKITALVIAMLFHGQFLQVIEPYLHLRDKIQPKISAFLLKAALARLNEGAPGAAGSSEGLLQPAVAQTAISLTDYILLIGSVLLLFLLTSLLINILIGIVINPIANSLGIINRGGGLLFGVLGSFIVVCLFVGLASPLLALFDTAALNPEGSVLYPVFQAGYEIIKVFISAAAGDFLTNPLKGFGVTGKSV
ncbi:hypothetical protein Sgly_3355 [Syntrophobotulus glycolicus DSM 8271]|uniref:Colicin V production protein n=1 Tax=Syntrophobotulus glycolicus (strain DSM 8271 / FlGlyR) TaxID=645991 RepID=F0T2Y0_SYNGF|nr:CvpA family protein [Syntrophobotulus glycolicus]ADY57617.1 hypothetical protein Sgly_3355 [Syntrophobotulus glycolicus DSM 8271]